MTGPEHFLRAEQLAEEAHNRLGQGDEQATAAVWAAVAQLHATLAVAAAIEAGSGSRRGPVERREHPPAGAVTTVAQGLTAIDDFAFKLTGTEKPPSVQHNQGHQPSADRNRESPREAERAVVHTSRRSLLSGAGGHDWPRALRLRATMTSPRRLPSIN
jgi:hypothetical protein